jgi:hypothetical protein
VIAFGEEQHQRLLRRLDLPALEHVAHAFDLMLGAAAPHPRDDTPATGAQAGTPPPH